MPDMIGPYPLDSIITGDARELAKAIPDESIDLIFTDPPYHPDLMYLYADMSEYAARILKPGGLCIAYAGVAFLDAVIQAMGTALSYFWIFCGYQPESNLVFNSKNVGCHWRPVLAYSKGPTRLRFFVGDTCRTNHDKRYHEWGQGEQLPVFYLSRITEQQDIIFDPFTGGGTVPAVCKKLRRHYLAFEIDPEVAERARERVHNTQPPLEYPAWETAEMFIEGREAVS